MSKLQDKKFPLPDASLCATDATASTSITTYIPETQFNSGQPAIQPPPTPARGLVHTPLPRAQATIYPLPTMMAQTGASLQHPIPQRGLTVDPVARTAIETNATATDLAQRRFHEQSLSLCHTFDRASRRCILCMLNNPASTAEHDVTQCPQLRGRCISCAQVGHFADATCRVRFHSGACYGCALPFRIGTSTVHAMEMGSRCTHPLRAKLIPIAWYVFRQPHYRAQMCRAFCCDWANDQEYRDWLPQLFHKEGLPLVTNILMVFDWAVGVVMP